MSHFLSRLVLFLGVCEGATDNGLLCEWTVLRIGLNHSMSAARITIECHVT